MQFIIDDPAAVTLILRIPGLGDLPVARGMDALELAASIGNRAVPNYFDLLKEALETDCEDETCPIHGKPPVTDKPCNLKPGCGLKLGHLDDCLVLH